MGKDIDKKGDKTVAKNKKTSTILVEAFLHYIAPSDIYACTV